MSGAHHADLTKSDILKERSFSRQSLIRADVKQVWVADALLAHISDAFEKAITAPFAGNVSELTQI